MPYSAQREQLARRQKLLDMLAQQSVTQNPTQMVSGRAVPQGFMQQLTPVLQAMMAKEGGADITARRGELDTQQAKDTGNAVQQAMTKMQGLPEAPAHGPMQPNQAPLPNYPEAKPNPMGAAMDLASNPLTSDNKAVQALMLQQNKPVSAGGGRPYFSPKESVIYDDDGQPSIRTEVFDHRSGEYLPSKTERISPKDPRIQELTAGSKARGTKTEGGNVERYQTWVQDGVAAADAMATTKKAKALLDSIRTSGLNAVVLQAKQFFGVEGGDEAQLSANLGKAVLAQLRPTFGAQFTASEGAKLERIEAGFGSSVEGNKRLLDQAIQLFDRAARRGQSAANKLGDDFSYGEIEKAMGMEIKEPKPEKPVLPPASDLKLPPLEGSDLQEYEDWKRARGVQ